MTLLDRKVIEDQIELLIAILDRLDGDPDAEGYLSSLDAPANPAAPDIEMDFAESGIADYDALELITQRA